MHVTARLSTDIYIAITSCTMISCKAGEFNLPVKFDFRTELIQIQVSVDF